MFDWDRDYESVVEAPHAVGPAAVADLLPEPTPTPGLWQRLRGRLEPLARRWAMAGAVVLGLAMAGLAPVILPQGGAGQWAALLLGTGEAAMPEGLIAYDRPEYDNFRRGIARFSDADLLHFLRHAERDMAAGSPIADFTRDALYLAQREVDRRGLQRPMASLRDAFGRS